MHAWSIPKGLMGADEAPLSAARREFAEETGHDPVGDFLPLGRRDSRVERSFLSAIREGRFGKTRMTAQDCQIGGAHSKQEETGALRFARSHRGR
jgi:8-oxo-dGTP pyrophosphatase MutT (NUDIX family)